MTGLGLEAFAVVLFALAAGLGYLLAQYLCLNLEALPDGPEQVHIPLPLALAGAALVGFAYAHYLNMFNAVVIFSPAITVLTACLYVDAKTGLIPDRLILPAIAAVLIYDAVIGHYLPFINMLIATLPFAMQAWQSKGLGMGWGDVKLVAYAGALIGAAPTLMAATFAIVLMYCVNKIAKRSKDPCNFPGYARSVFALGTVGAGLERVCNFVGTTATSKPKDPVAFAPYLVFSYAIAISFCS